MAIVYTCPCGLKTVVTTGKVVGELHRCPACQRVLSVYLPPEKRVVPRSALEYAGLVCPHCGEGTTFSGGVCTHCQRPLFEAEEVLVAEVKVESEPVPTSVSIVQVVGLFFREPGHLLERLSTYLSSVRSLVGLVLFHILSLVPVALVGVLLGPIFFPYHDPATQMLNGVRVTLGVSLTGVLVASVIFSLFASRLDSYRGFLPMLFGVVFMAGVVNWFLYVPVILRIALVPVGGTTATDMMWLSLGLIYLLKMGLFAFGLSRMHRLAFSSLTAFLAVGVEIGLFVVIALMVSVAAFGEGYYATLSKMLENIFGAP